MSAPVVLTKRCRDCGETKPASEFHVQATARDGLRPYCKPCTIARVNASVARRRAAMGDEAWYAHRRAQVNASRRRTGGAAGLAYNRARYAAFQALADRHRKEFEHLLLLARRGELDTPS